MIIAQGNNFSFFKLHFTNQCTSDRLHCTVSIVHHVLSAEVSSADEMCIFSVLVQHMYCLTTKLNMFVNDATTCWTRN